jgi:hypothetical protein
MIDILYNKLGASNDASVAEWKDVDAEIFKKHSQHSLQIQCMQHMQHMQNNVKDAVKDVNTVKDINEEKNVIPEITEEPLSKPLQMPTIPPILAKNKRKDTKDQKDTANKPLNIIISETTSFNNSTEYIKDALITMISKDEFAKVFGLTKCAEIMSGIVNNRWNKSTALFISFLLDKEVYYNDNIVIYNKEKNKGRITITKT